MRRIMCRKVFALILTAAMLSGVVNTPVYADEVQMPDSIQAAEDEAAESVDPEESLVTDIVPSTSDEDLDGGIETEESEEDVNESSETSSESDILLEAAGFTELDESIVLTKEQIDSKQNLASRIDEIENCEAGEDYADNQIVVEAEDYETAVVYAEAYNATLEHYESGIALLELNPGDADPEKLSEVSEIASADMVSAAVCASADIDTNLPAAWPNYYDELLDTEFDYAEFRNFGVEYNDPMLANSDSNFQWHHEIVGSNAAWRAGYRGQGIKVAIIDSGGKTSSDITWVEGKRVNDNITDDNYIDTNGHGTAVSGIIGAVADNNTGGAGIAPECDMYMLKVVSDAGKITTYSQAVAVGRAVEIYDVDVINISIGGVNYSEYYENSINQALKNGVAVVCAAGNDGLGASLYPAAYKGAISVAATNRSGSRASLSNYGPEIRYGAPGEKVGLEWLDSSYSIEDGTSFSAPIISGMIAVILSSGKVTGTGSKRVDSVLRLLDKSCSGDNTGLGKGIPNLALALGLDTNLSTPGIVNASVPTGTYSESAIDIELMTENSGSAHEDLIFYSDNGIDVSFTNGRPSSNAKKYDPVEKITITGKRTTVIKAIAVNPSNGMVSRQTSFIYSLKPFVSDLDISTDTGLFNMQKGGRLVFTAKCTPAYAGNRAVTYAVTGFPAGSVSRTRAYISENILYAPASVTPGTYTVTCTAKDADHYSESFDVEVSNPDRKVYSISASKTSLVMYSGIPENISIPLKTIEGKTKYDETAADYSTWTSSDPGIATASITGNTLTINASKAGRVAIKGVSNDGTKVSRSISITVRSHPDSLAIDPIAGGKVGIGKSVRLAATVLPVDTYNKAVIWSITGKPAGATDKTSATINTSNGTFYATKAVPGIYTVRATAKDKDNAGNEVYDEYSIEVYGALTKSITLDKNSSSIYRVKNTYNSPNKDSIEVILNGGCYETLTSLSNNPGIAQAALRQEDSGKIYLDIKATGGGTGTARITVKANDGTGKSATISVTVSNPPSYLEIAPPSGASSNIAKGKSVKLTAKFGTLYGKLTSATQKLVWTSNDPDIVSVNQNGVITGRCNEGHSATITARTTDGLMATSIYVSSVPNTTSITTDGLWKRMQRTSGGVTTYFGEYISFIESGKTGYISLESASNVTDGNAGRRSPINGSYCDISVNKPGLSAKWSSASRETGKPNATIALYANTPGTYYVTVKMKDLSPALKKIKVVVK